MKSPPWRGNTNAPPRRRPPCRQSARRRQPSRNWEHAEAEGPAGPGPRTATEPCTPSAPRAAGSAPDDTATNIARPRTHTPRGPEFLAARTRPEARDPAHTDWGRPIAVPGPGCKPATVRRHREIHFSCDTFPGLVARTPESGSDPFESIGLPLLRRLRDTLRMGAIVRLCILRIFFGFVESGRAAKTPRKIWKDHAVPEGTTYSSRLAMQGGKAGRVRALPFEGHRRAVRRRSPVQEDGCC
jgi:hypothetical protein